MQLRLHDNCLHSKRILPPMQKLKEQRLASRRLAMICDNLRSLQLVESEAAEISRAQLCVIFVQSNEQHILQKSRALLCVT